MIKRIINLSLMATGLVLLGAACVAKTTVTTGNKNISATTTINTSLGTSNSSTTGDFTTTTNTAEPQ